MRPPSAAVLLAASVALGMTVVACFDLFHSTGDLLSACQLDAAAAGCPASRSPEAESISFCTWTSAEAREHAQRACARLGACESPTGTNAFGACMFQALLAFDCGANPNHPASGAALALWRCLSTATTCADVDRCVFDGTPPGLCEESGNYATCARSASVDLRVDCVDGGTAPLPRAAGENCALWGETCAIVGGVGTCTGPSESPTDGGCTRTGCYGGAGALHWCADGTDIGIDCASNGAQRCAGFPPQDASWVACVPLADSGACPASETATCDDHGVGHACPLGVSERIDCAQLLGQPNACQAGAISPSFDWTSPCAVSPPQCSADSCVDGGIVGCTRGAAFAADCASLGLGPCSMVPVTAEDGGLELHAACASR